MYKDKTKHIVRAIALIVLILLILLFMVVYFVSGPIVIDKQIDEKLLEQVEQTNKLSGCSLANRFTNDETYYVAKCVAHYLVYDDEGKVLKKVVVKDFDSTKTDLDLDGFEISIGYYQNKVVFVCKNEKREVLFDYETYEILRDYSFGRK